MQFRKLCKKLRKLRLLNHLYNFALCARMGSSTNNFSSSDAGCPSTLKVLSAKKPWIEGQYEITNQTRRGQSVWYNKAKKIFLSVAITNSWQIQSEKSYYADKDMSYARSTAKLPALSGTVWCPQNLVYLVWTSGEWIKDIKVLG